MKRLLVAAAISLTVLPAKAEEGTGSGNFLLKGCQSAVAANRSDYYAGYCMGLVEAAAAAAIALHLACIPEQVTNGQVARVVLNYLQDNPQDLHKDGKSLAIIAMGVAWPCPKKKP